MATYDFRCKPCKLTEERSCMMAEADSQKCERCGKTMERLFSPTTNVYVPQSFKYATSDLYGTSSMKDWLKDNPTATRINRSTFKTKREMNEAKWAANNRKVADMEKALIAQGKMKRPRAKKGDKPITVG